MLKLTKLSLASVEDLFRYKKSGFKLDPFPGYTEDQWGIKAHNRPWIEDAGKFSANQRIIEVGGAYSLLPQHLQSKYSLESWIGDDFGAEDGGDMWSRWGNPHELPKQYPDIKYVFQPFGCFSDSYPNNYFDRIFSVSTLEHIPIDKRLNVIKDMNRCLNDGGMQLHSIDISIPSIKRCLINTFSDKVRVFSKLSEKLSSEICQWVRLFEESGIQLQCSIPSALSLLDRAVLVESPDVVYRFYPPNDSPKSYEPAASLLVIIENTK